MNAPASGYGPLDEALRERVRGHLARFERRAADLRDRRAWRWKKPSRNVPVRTGPVKAYTRGHAGMELVLPYRDAAGRAHRRAPGPEGPARPRTTPTSAPAVAWVMRRMPSSCTATSKSTLDGKW